ncbi:MAG TPA: hypothetical protein P5267_03445 [Patescibacteria group bacterium]|nr:hypothetical protein [Patescibacteria group bacterium]
MPSGIGAFIDSIKTIISSMPSKIEIVFYMIKEIALMNNSEFILIPLVFLIIIFIYLYFTKPIKDILIKDDEIILYLAGGAIKHLNFNEFNKLEMDAHRGRITFVLNWQDEHKPIVLYGTPKTRNVVKKIIQASGLKKTRNLGGLSWGKEAGYQATEDDLKFDLIKKETFLSLFIVLFLGVLLVFVLIYFLDKYKLIIK